MFVVSKIQINSVHPLCIVTNHFFSQYMKKTVVLLAFCCACLSQLQAQNLDYRSNISATAGLNLWQLGSRLDNLIEGDSVIGFYANATPTFALNYDYALQRWFSLGLNVTYNRLKAGADQVGVTVNDKRYEGEVGVNIRRTNIGLRGLFHYVNNDRVDVYSGLRVGANIVRTGLIAETDDIPREELLKGLLGNSLDWALGRNFSSVRPSFQVIPIGIRTYITPNIGIGIETAIGVTYYAAANLNVRF
jgi:opacity protein-like surface antigen